MTIDQSEKKVLIMGASGLVGTSLFNELVSSGYKDVVLHSLKRDINFEKKVKYYTTNKDIHVSVVYSNVLMRVQEKNKTIEEVVTNKKQIKSFTNYLLESIDDVKIRKTPIWLLFNRVQPSIVIDCINTATQVAYNGFSSDPFRSTGIGMFVLLRYYQALNIILDKKNNSTFGWNKTIDYYKVGTTGVGGMGLNLPFTHGEEKPSISLLKKIAFAGAQTNLLFAIKNNHFSSKISQIVPAASIFNDKLIIQKSRKKNRLCKHVLIDGGESGGYALEEFRLLTRKDEMGVVFSDELAKMIKQTIQNGEYDILASLEKGVIRPSLKSQMRRDKLLQNFESLQKREQQYCIAHGKLGPKMLRRIIFESKIFLDFFKKNQYILGEMNEEKKYKNLVKWVSKNNQLISEIKDCGLSIVMKYSIRKMEQYRVEPSIIDISILSFKSHLKKIINKHKNSKIFPTLGQYVKGEIDNYEKKSFRIL